MNTEIYFSAALLGVFLALICILGWRRIVPCLVGASLLTICAPSAFGQYGDYDDDVPAINEVRDMVYAQMTMLDNYFSGYTSPNKLNDISNALYDGGGSATDKLNAIRGYQSQISQNTDGIEPKLDGISNALSSGGVTILDRQQSIQNNTLDTNRYLSGYYGGPLNDINNALYSNSGNEYLGNIDSSQWYIKNYLSSLDGRTYDSDDDVPTLEEIRDALLDPYSISAADRLFNILGTQYEIRDKVVDTDNDVPTLQNIELNITDLDLHNQASALSIISKLEEIKLATENVNYDDGSIQTNYEPNTANVTAPTWTPPTTSELPIQDNIENLDLGGLADVSDVTDLFPSSGFESNDVPLFGTGGLASFTAPTLIGGSAVQDNINYKMNQHFDTTSDIIKPILTCFLMWLVIRWTTQRTVNLVAA